MISSPAILLKVGTLEAIMVLGCLDLNFWWSGREDLNLRPPRPERGALPGCATPRQYYYKLVDEVRQV